MSTSLASRHVDGARPARIRRANGPTPGTGLGNRCVRVGSAYRQAFYSDDERPGRLLLVISCAPDTIHMRDSGTIRFHFAKEAGCEPTIRAPKVLAVEGARLENEWVRKRQATQKHLIAYHISELAANTITRGLVY